VRLARLGSDSRWWVAVGEPMGGGGVPGAGQLSWVRIDAMGGSRRCSAE
jgi:hypothetical protein